MKYINIKINFINLALGLVLASSCGNLRHNNMKVFSKVFRPKFFKRLSNNLGYSPQYQKTLYNRRYQQYNSNKKYFNAKKYGLYSLLGASFISKTKKNDEEKLSEKITNSIKEKNYEDLEKIINKKYDTREEFCEILDKIILSIFIHNELSDDEKDQILKKEFKKKDFFNQGDGTCTFKATPACFSIYYGSYYAFTKILDHNPKVFEECGGYGVNALNIISREDSDIIRKLGDLPMDTKVIMIHYLLYHQDIDTSTALYWLSKRGEYKIVELILKNSDYKGGKYKKDSPLMGIAWAENITDTSKHLKIAELLIKHGYDPYDKDSLKWAGLCGNYRYFELLIKKGYHPRSDFECLKELDCYDPLVTSIRYWHRKEDWESLKCAKILIDNTCCQISEEILKFAKEKGRTKIVDMIKKKNKQIDELTKLGFNSDQIKAIFQYLNLQEKN